MIDGSVKRKRQLVFEFKISRVYEKRSKAKTVSLTTRIVFQVINLNN